MKLSIITINCNNAHGLCKTLESVVSQTFTDFEYIVIDGASTDGSVDVIKQYADKITYWVSEPDKGIYNAMNKGILKAKGEYLLFLNSGDWLADKNVVFDFSHSVLKEDIITGDIMLWDNGNAVLRESLLKDDLCFDFFYNDTLPHPSTFIRKELFSNYGLYNENNKVISDTEFFFKVLVLNNCSFNHFDRIISFFDLTGISSQAEWKLIERKELENVIKTHLPLVDKSFQKLTNEKLFLLTHEKDYYEYMNLKNGKFSLLIKFLLWTKKMIK